MSSDTHHREADQNNRRDTGRDGEPQAAARRSGGADWEADARAQIIALLSGDDDGQEDVPDLGAVRRAYEQTDADEEEQASPALRDAGEEKGAWLNRARRRMASLFGEDDAQPVAPPEHPNEQPEQDGEPAVMHAPDASEPEQDEVANEQRSEFTLDWVVDVAAESPAAAASTEAQEMQDERTAGADAVSGGAADAASVAEPDQSVAAVGSPEETAEGAGRAGETESSEPDVVAEDGGTPDDGDTETTAEQTVEPHVEAAPAASDDTTDHADAPAADAQPEAKQGLSPSELEELAGLLNDPIVIEALEAGAVPLSQLVLGVRRHRQDPSIPLWRHMVNVPGVDRDDLYARAAQHAGFESVDLTEDRPSSTFLHTVLGIYPRHARKQLIELHLLPFAFEPDAEAAEPGFLIATHDPTAPAIQHLVPDLEPVIQLYYAPEQIVARRIEEMREMEAAFDWVDEDPEDDAADAAAPNEPVDAHETDSERAVAESEDGPTDELADDAGAAGDIDEIDDPDLPAEVAGSEAQELHATEEPPETDESGAAEISADEVAGADEPLEAEAEADEMVAAGEQHQDAVPAAASALAAAGAEAPPSDVGGGGATDVAVLDEQDNTVPPSDTDGGLTADQRALVVQDRALLDQMEVVRITEPEEAPDPISGDGYGDLSLADGQQGEDVGDDFVDLPDEPPLPPDVSWGDEPPAAPTTQQAALETKDRVVAMLLHKEMVTAEQVQQARDRKEGQDLKETLWRVLASVDGVPREAIFREAATMYAFPILPDGAEGPDPDFARNVMNTFGESERDQLISLRVLPYELDVEEQSGTVRLAFVTHDPTRPEVHKLMKKLHLERFELMYATEEVVGHALAEAFPRKNEYLERMNEGDDALDLGAVYQDDEELIDDEALEAEINRSTLINLFEASLIEAVRRGASDLHIYPNANKQVEIHFRVDGRLAHWHTEEKVHPEAMLAVIKDNSTNVDRFERDAAQDGFIQRWIDDALIRFRVSVLPIANASQELRSESIVIRVLDDRKVITDLSKLGLLEGALERFSQAIHQPHGMVILTGPTGSGKSTTLVASLHQVVSPEVNVLTVEDPVEYIIPGVRQIKLNHKLDLSGALRAILRHDPDVVMVGEMRDRKTAELAIKLANTGHLTFSTLHTNDAPSAISRLYKMGIEPFLIAYAINLVVAQRLIRTLCSECKVPDPDPDTIMLEQLGFSEQEIAESTFYMPAKDDRCPKCRGQGYKGRRAISEALYFSRPIRHMIVEADGMIDESKIRALAEKEGMLSLSASAREVVKMGETSAREMMRVVATGD